MPEEALFSPIEVGSLTLAHRIVLAPLTRYRNNDDGSPNPSLAVPYYSARALVPGTLLIAEATDASFFAGSLSNVPGIYTDDHIAAWRAVTDAVHARRCFIFLQLWSVGRVNPGQKQPVVYGPSPIPNGNGQIPKELTIHEIKQLEEDFVTAAKNAIYAGFDGVEIHGAHGYLVDQFLQDVSNARTDEYGGSIENRARFALEIIDKLTTMLGAHKVAIRLSPFSQLQSMGMEDPYPQFAYVVSKLQETHSNLAYIHFVEPRVSGGRDRDFKESESTDPYRKLWKGPWIAAGGFTPESAKQYAATHEDSLVAFGRHFISNPDLVARIREGLPLRSYNRDTFYLPKAVEGYLGYDYAEELKGIYF
ncbi:hypothetical protein V1509DRAFT_496329 [Lipomyces kononenkoae]